MTKPTPNQAQSTDTRKHFEAQFQANSAALDRLFAWLMVIQYLGCILAAFLVAPRTWAGSEYSTNFHVWSTLILGGLATIPTAFGGLTRSGSGWNRYAFAVSQMIYSILIVHLSGGRVESHFHIFVSIAFLAAYRDPGVILAATVIVAVDHIGRGLFWPQSIFGIDTASLLRPIEHAAWLIFEDVIVVWMILKNRKEMWSLSEHVHNRAAERDALMSELENLRHVVGSAANGDLSVEVHTSQLAETELLSDDLRRMINDLRSMIAGINQQSDIVREQANGFAVRTKSIGDLLESQQGTMGAIDQAMQTMQTTIEEIEVSIGHAISAKTEATQQARLSEMAISASEQSMAALQSSSQRIDSIVEEICEIAEQTALLSLNATIEAARAGESGKGFAVVASEVKELARKANVAANSISDLIRDSLDRVEEGVAASKTTTLQFRKIIEAVQAIDQRIGDVTTATKRQAEQTAQVDALVREVHVATTRSSESCQEVSTDSQRFRQIAEDLDRQLNRFTIEPTDDLAV